MCVGGQDKSAHFTCLMGRQARVRNTIGIQREHQQRNAENGAQRSVQRSRGRTALAGRGACGADERADGRAHELQRANTNGLQNKTMKPT
jgi:hypothetical protein